MKTGPSEYEAGLVITLRSRSVSV